MSQKTTTIKEQNLMYAAPLATNELLKELRLLRREIMLILPQDDLEDYAHEERIKQSYKKAIEKYPPMYL